MLPRHESHRQDSHIHALPKSTNGKPQRCRLLHDRVIMRLKFEVIDSTGRVHKRSSTSHIYSHCVVIHFEAHLPSKLWPKGVAGFSHAEWGQSCQLAERMAARWRTKPGVEAIEVLEASAMPFPTQGPPPGKHKRRC
jgi:hypothetical protein